MHGNSIAIAAILIASAAATAQTPPAPPIRFDWPAGSRAVVTETRINAIPGPKITTVLRYEIMLEKDRGNYRINFGSVRHVETTFGEDTPEPMRRALHRQTIDFVRPDLLVGHDGAWRRTLDYERSRERALRAEPKDRRASARTTTRAPEFRPFVENSQAILWHNWVGHWSGLRHGTTQRTLRETFANGNVLPARSTDKLEATEQGLVKVESNSVIDRAAALEQLREVDPGAKIAKFRFEIDRTAEIDPTTQLPHAVEVVRSGTLTRVGKPPQPVSETTRWTFEWQSPAAAPTRR